MPDGLRMSDARLRGMAHERILDGRLPVMFSPTFRPQYGANEACQLCGQTIDRYHVQYEVTDPRSGYELLFHLVCYRIWQVECWAPC